MRSMNILSPDLTRPEHPEMAVVYVPTTSLQPYARNARTHNKQQIKMIAGSIKAFGFTNPILTDQNNTIVAGHPASRSRSDRGRVLARANSQGAFQKRTMPTHRRSE